MATIMTIAAILCVTPCVLVEMYWYFRWFCLLQHPFLFFSFLFHYHISPRTMQQNSSKSPTVPVAYCLHNWWKYCAWSTYSILWCLILHIYYILYILYVYDLFYILPSFSKMLCPWNLYMCVCMLCMCVCVYVCMCVFMYVYVCISTHLYIYIYTIFYIHLFSLHAPLPWSNTTCIVYTLHVVSFYTLYI